MDVFHVFKIVQMVPNCAKHHDRLTNFVPTPNIAKTLTYFVPMFLFISMLSSIPLPMFRIFQLLHLPENTGMHWYKYKYTYKILANFQYFETVT